MFKGACVCLVLSSLVRHDNRTIWVILILHLYYVTVLCVIISSFRLQQFLPNFILNLNSHAFPSHNSCPSCPVSHNSYHRERWILTSAFHTAVPPGNTLSALFHIREPMDTHDCISCLYDWQAEDVTPSLPWNVRVSALLAPGHRFWLCHSGTPDIPHASIHFLCYLSYTGFTWSLESWGGHLWNPL